LFLSVAERLSPLTADGKRGNFHCVSRASARWLLAQFAVPKFSTGTALQTAGAAKSIDVIGFLAVGRVGIA